MSVPAWLENTYYCITDLVFAFLPQSIPSSDVLSQAKLIAHRGVYDNKTVLENTLPAFDAALTSHCFGIECDVRWTKDCVPIIHHDASLKRLFSDKRIISQMTFSELRQNFPQIPTLNEIIARFGGRLHLMIEIKDEPYLQPLHQKTILRQALLALTPGVDFHIITLTPSMLETLDFLPSVCLLPIATTAVDTVSRLALDKKYGGLLGHYSLIQQAIIARHRAVGQKTGTGQVNSLKCLYRELNRGVEWIFSDKAPQLTLHVTDLLSAQE